MAMKLRRFAAVAASVIAATAMGVTSAGAAPANVSSGYRALCVISPSEGYICALGKGELTEVGIAFADPTNWYYPTGGYATIRQANSLLCMQVDHDAGNLVLEAGCSLLTNQPAYQQWSVIGGSEIRTKWDPSANLCLTYNASGLDFDVAPCNSNHPWYQVWHAVPSNKV